MMLLVQNLDRAVVRYGIAAGHIGGFNWHMAIDGVEAIIVRLAGSNLVHQMASRRKVPAEQLHFPHGERLAGHDNDSDILEDEVIRNRSKELPEGARNPLECGDSFPNQPIGETGKSLDRKS